MKNICCFLLSLALLTCNAGAEEVQNWYVKYPDGGGRPVAMNGDTDVLEKYGALYLGDAEEKVIYLTFDAGYGNESLDSILATLKKHEVTAAFFILPALTKYALPTVEKMIADGHLICNHSYSHGNMGRISDVKALQKELTAAEEDFYNATGEKMSKFFRPPEGAFSENLLAFCKELGYTPVFWSFAYADWDNDNQPDAEEATEKILSTAHNGEIMLLHPNSATNAAILDRVLTALTAEGYRFGSLTELVDKDV